MRILITGASGLIGSALVHALRTEGHEVRRMVRSRGKLQAGDAHWDPGAGEIDLAALEELDAVVHLAGENIAAGRWTASKKARIRDSRVEGTRFLCDRLARLASPPGVLVCASAVGCYGNRGDEILDEQSSRGTGFLADVCAEWEAASEPARERGIRVAHQRLGVVLSERGGALAKMLGIFRKGLGGRLGSGAQYMSWLTLEDTVGAFRHVIDTDGLEGPFNTTAPGAVTNAEFTAVLGGVLGRPAFCHAPAFALRLALGEMADEALLASVRAAPAKLLESGYEFQHPELEGALRAVLGRPG